MIKILAILSVISSLELLAWSLVYSQTDEARDTIDQGPETLLLVMEVAQSAKETTAPFHVLVTIHNQTNKEWVIDSLLVVPPQAISETRAYRAAVPCLQRTIAPQSTVKCLKNIPRGEMRPIRSLIRHTLFFLPGTYPITAILVYRESVPKKPSRVELTQATVVFHPPIVSLFAGGVIGATLISLFMTIYLMRKSKDHNAKSVAKNFGSGLLLIGFGSVVAIIAILLFQQTNDIGLPIALEVTDYRGGIVFGLFSLYLGELFYQRFRESHPNGDPPHKTNPTGAGGQGAETPAAR